MKTREENPAERWLENQFVGLDMFADTDKELTALGMTEEDLVKFRAWQVNNKKVNNSKPE